MTHMKKNILVVDDSALMRRVMCDIINSDSKFQATDYCRDGLEAYEKLTGKELDESVVDAAMDELVTTGDLEQSIDGDSNDVVAMIADLKGQIACGKIKTPEEMEQAIEKLADKYDLKLSDDDKQKLLGLMKKLQGLDLNWDSIKNQASAWASQLQNQLADKNIGQKIAAFFEKLFDMIRSLFQK